MTLKRGRLERLKDRIRENRVPLFWLSLLIAALVTFYGAKAPAVILAVLFRYTLILFLFMLMPFVTGLAGWTRATRSACLKALLLPVLLRCLPAALPQEHLATLVPGRVRSGLPLGPGRSLIHRSGRKLPARPRPALLAGLDRLHDTDKRASQG